MQKLTQMDLKFKCSKSVKLLEKSRRKSSGSIPPGPAMKTPTLGGWGVEVKEAERGPCRRFAAFSACEEASRMWEPQK